MRRPITSWTNFLGKLGYKVDWKKTRRSVAPKHRSLQMQALESREMLTTVNVSLERDLAEGGQQGSFLFTRDVTTGSLTVNYTINADGQDGRVSSGDISSPALSGSVEFTDGSSTVSLSVTAADDSTTEQTESIPLSLASGDYTIGSPNSATMSLYDNDGTTSGPYVTQVSPSSSVSGSFDRFTLTFDRAIRAESFTLADVTVTGPGGSISPTALNRLSDTQDEIVFASQTAAGVYTITVGPQITDLSGNAMNQDGDSVNGESTADRFVGTNTINTAPTLTSFADAVATTNEDTEVEISFSALQTQGNEADAEGSVQAFVAQAVTSGTLRIGASAGSATSFTPGTNDTIDGTNKAYWTPAANVNGLDVAAFTVKAKDNEGALSDTAVQVNVDVTPVADPPTDVTLSAANVAENSPSGTMVGTFSTTDADSGDTFTYTLVPGEGSTHNSSFSIDESGNLHTAAAFDYEGQSSYSIRVRSTDQSELSFEKVFTISVTDVNEAPVLDTIGNQNVDQQVTLTFTATATDPDQPPQTLTYSLDSASLSRGMTIDPATGVFSWTPSAGQRGASYPVTVTVMDNGTNPPALSDSETFDITVPGVSVGLSSSRLSSSYGDKVVFTATVPEGATGSVTFQDGATTLGTAAVAGGVATFTTSDHQNVLQLDGYSGYVDCGDTPSQDLGAQATISAWVNVAGIGTNNGFIVIKQNAPWSTGASYGLVYEIGQGKFAFSLATQNNAWHDYFCSGPISQNTWYHVVGVYDGSSVKIYLNGQLNATHSGVTGNLITATGNLLIGKENSWTTEHLKGAVSEVAIFNRSVSDAEVMALYNGASVTNGLVAGWHLDERSGTTTIADYSGHGNNGTVTGNAAWVATSTISGTAPFVTPSLAIGNHSITAVYNGDSHYPSTTSSAVSHLVSGALLWDPDGANNGVFGGSGNWNATGAWVDACGNRYTWDGSLVGARAVFSGSGGTVTLNSSITVSSLSFQTDGYTITSGAGSSAMALAATGCRITTAYGIHATIQSVLEGSGTLMKLGGGTLTLSGNNTHSGGTTVSRGDLNVTGSLASTVTVASGGTLSGSGSTGNLAFTAGSQYRVELTDSGCDEIHVTGTVNLANVTLSATGSRVSSAGDVLVLITNDGSDAVTGMFRNLSEGAVVNAGPSSYLVTYCYNAEMSVAGGGNDVALIATNPTVTLSSSSQSSNYGESVTFTATVPQGATGNVSFMDGATTLGTAAVSSHGTATYTAASHQQVLKLDGYSGYVDCGDNPSQDLGAQATVATWSALSEEMPILRKLNHAIRVLASATGDDSPISLIGDAFDAEPIVTEGVVSCFGYK